MPSDEELYKDVANLLANISLSSGLSDEQLNGCTEYIVKLVHEAEIRARIDELRELNKFNVGEVANTQTISDKVTKRLATLTAENGKK